MEKDIHNSINGEPLHSRDDHSRVPNAKANILRKENEYKRSDFTQQLSPTATDDAITQLEEKSVYNKSAKCNIHVENTELYDDEKKIIKVILPGTVPHNGEINNTTMSPKVGKVSVQGGGSSIDLETDWQKLLKQLYERIVTLEQQNRELSITLSNQQATITSLQNHIDFNETETLNRNCNGIFIWRLNSFSEQLNGIISDHLKMVYSPGFYTNPNGYKMCARMNVSSKNTKYLSIVLHIMKSNNDDALDWPFHGIIYFTLIHPTIPGKSIKERAVSSPDLEAFQKPMCTLNKRSFGYTEFISLSDIGEFVHEDQLIFRIEVKT